MTDGGDSLGQALAEMNWVEKMGRSGVLHCFVGGSWALALAPVSMYHVARSNACSATAAAGKGNSVCQSRRMGPHFFVVLLLLECGRLLDISVCIAEEEDRLKPAPVILSVAWSGSDC